MHYIGNNDFRDTIVQYEGAVQPKTWHARQ